MPRPTDIIASYVGRNAVQGSFVGAKPAAGVVVPSAFSAAKYAIAQGAADVNILVLGDSTGTETHEWPHLLGEWLFEQYPTHSVSYRLWNNGAGSYDAAASLGTGSGPRTIRIWNASVSGARPNMLQGTAYAAAVAAIPTPTMVFWNYGHNDLTEANAAVSRGVFLGMMEMVRLTHPTASHLLTLQNPRRDTTDYNYIIPIITEISTDRGDTPLIDVHSAFLALGKPPELYADDIHPSAAGQQVWIGVIKRMWGQAAQSAFVSFEAWLDSVGTNLLTTPRPVNSGGTLQADWAAIGSATVTADTVEKDVGQTYSSKVTATAAQSGVRATLSAANLLLAKGQIVTVAVRQKVPPGSAATAGRIGLFWTGGNSTSLVTVDGHGGWRWLIISGQLIDPAAATVFVNCYADTAVSAGSTAYYERAVMVLGDIPRDII